MPSCLLAVLKSIYDNDEYVLVDGCKRAHVHPRLGVKQGCPLSPLLFSLYINDVDCLAENVRGAVTGTGDLYVTHMLYADDLCLTANRPDELQRMLDALHAYAQRKGLIINVSKSEVVPFNSKGNNVAVLSWVESSLCLLSHSSIWVCFSQNNSIPFPLLSICVHLSWLDAAVSGKLQVIVS